MNCSCRVLLTLFLGLGLLNVPRPLSAQSSDRALLDKIAEAWRRREEATRSVEIVWEETETIPRDALTNHPALRRKETLGEAGKAPFPPADTTLKHRGQVVLDGDRIRYEGEREGMGSQAEIFHESYVSAYDARQTKTLRRSSRAEWPSGQIWNEPFFHDRPMVEIAHILWGLRSNNALLGKVPLESCHVSKSRPAKGEYADCVVLLEDAPPGARIEYWLRPTADYAIVRKTTQSDGKIETDYEIRYTRDASGVWLPAAWSTTWYKPWDGKLHFTQRGQVTSCKLNVAPPESTFDLEFPSDALVSIMGDTPETTIDLVRPKRSWLEWALLAGGVAALALLAAVFLRRWIRRGQSSWLVLAGFLAMMLSLTPIGQPNLLYAQGSDQALLDKIAEAWRRREEATRSVDIMWEETETIPRDALTNHPALNRQAKLGEAGKAPFPAADTALRRWGRSLLSGDRIRYEGERENLSSKAEVWKDRYVSAFDGRQTKGLRFPRADAPVGQIWEEPSFHDRPMLEITPVLLSLRPGNSVLGKVDLQACRVSRARPGGAYADCLILVEDLAGGAQVECWLRPAADYAIVRKTSKSGSNVSTDLEIQYAHDAAANVWLPRNWRITWFKAWDGQMQFTVRGQVTNCSLNYEPSDKAFDVEFPSDALVSIMGATPETTIDLKRSQRPWFESTLVVLGIVVACLVVVRIVRKRARPH